MTAPDEFLAPIRERLAAATPGPWFREYGDVVTSEPDPRDVEEGYDEPRNVRVVRRAPHLHQRNRQAMNDADFIAHSPETQARLLAALDGVLTLTNERATTLRETSDRLSQQVIDRHPDRDSAAALRYAAYAQEAEAFAAKIRNTVTTALEGQG